MARKKRTNPKGNKQIKPQQPSFAGKAIKLIVIVILILGMLFGAGYCTWRFWLKDYIAAGKVFTIELDGKAYGNGTGGLLIAPGTELKVTTPHGKDYEVKIYASDKADFTFKLGAEPWEWKGMKGTEFTSGFDIAKTEEGFRLGYQSLNAIIERVHGQQVSEVKNAGRNIFELALICGNREMRILFGTYLPVLGVELDQDEIIFVTEGEE